MTGFEAAILGFIQGATEFLPVSSTGHLIIGQQLLGLKNDTFSFDIFLHFATILAVGIFFWRELLRLRPKDMVPILIASVPAGIVGVLWSDAIEHLSSSLGTTGWELLVTAGLNFGCAYLLTRGVKQAVSETESMREKTTPKSESVETVALYKVSPIQALTVGFFQAAAILPAVSRSGATVFAGLWKGLDRKTAFAFSFIISIPIILGANALQMLKIIKDHVAVPATAPLVIGSLVAFVVGLLSLYLLKYMITTAKFHYFGWYSLALGLIIIAGQYW